MLPLIDVACGVLVNAAGEVLMAQRPAGKLAAGYWEFPGGKIEPEESPPQALARELHEELGVTVVEAEPLIDFVHHYRDRRVRLRTYRVTAFEGDLHGREGQAFAWCRPESLLSLQPQLPTVTPIRNALRLPPHYAWTPAVADAEALSRLPPPKLPTGSLIRLRQPGWDAPRYAAAAPAWVAAQRAAGWTPILDRDAALSRELGCGQHQDGPALARTLSREVPPASWLLASAHTADEIELARSQGVDAVVVGAVRATPSHPGQPGLGWAAFSRLAAAAGLPVYALGGVGPDDLPAVQAAGAQGVAAIRAYFSASGSP